MITSRIGDRLWDLDATIRAGVLPKRAYIQDVTALSEFVDRVRLLHPEPLQLYIVGNQKSLDYELFPNSIRISMEDFDTMHETLAHGIIIFNDVRGCVYMEHKKLKIHHLISCYCAPLVESPDILYIHPVHAGAYKVWVGSVESVLWHPALAHLPGLFMNFLRFQFHDRVRPQLTTFLIDDLITIVLEFTCPPTESEFEQCHGEWFQSILAQYKR